MEVEDEYSFVWTDIFWETEMIFVVFIVDNSDTRLPWDNLNFPDYRGSVLHFSAFIIYMNR